MHSYTSNENNCIVYLSFAVSIKRLSPQTRMYSLIIATFFSYILLITAQPQKDCKWLCHGLLTDLQDYEGDPNKLAETLMDTCENDVKFGLIANDPIDTECPDFCKKFIPIIVKDKQLREDLANATDSMGAILGFCDKYDYGAVRKAP
ncbi:unnamed protein product [Cylicocyclus nassatus]|uniref:Uncharacterized protein n=1 Tax=Cylicocyclus nassatus TaxID=53992 RepID=A0AA36GKM3_CYLNA|nr:unnamed protein product [Cylicocyclus nassatus]